MVHATHEHCVADVGNSTAVSGCDFVGAAPRWVKNTIFWVWLNAHTAGCARHTYGVLAVSGKTDIPTVLQLFVVTNKNIDALQQIKQQWLKPAQNVAAKAVKLRTVRAV